MTHAELQTSIAKDLKAVLLELFLFLPLISVELITGPNNLRYLMSNSCVLFPPFVKHKKNSKMHTQVTMKSNFLIHSPLITEYLKESKEIWQMLGVLQNGPMKNYLTEWQLCANYSLKIITTKTLFYIALHSISYLLLEGKRLPLTVLC